MTSIDQTMLFNKDDFQEKSIEDTLLHVFDALTEKEYQPIQQIVGYLMSGDPAYIPRHLDARNLIRHYERDEMMEELLKAYLKERGRMN